MSFCPCSFVCVILIVLFCPCHFDRVILHVSFCLMSVCHQDIFHAILLVGEIFSRDIFSWNQINGSIADTFQIGKSNLLAAAIFRLYQGLEGRAAIILDLRELLHILVYLNIPFAQVQF